MTDAGLLNPEEATVVSVELKRKVRAKVEGPKLPARLDAAGALTWEITGDLLSHVEDGFGFYG